MAFMKVLLREDIENLGDRGAIVRVRLGYGRNYLLPHGLAVQASDANMRQIEQEKRVLNKRELREKAAAAEASKSIEGVELKFERRVGEEGRLFGSVTTIDIARALEEMGKTVDRHKVRLKDPIKSIGEFEVPVKLHRDVVVNLKVVVTPEGGVMPTSEAVRTEDLPGYVAPGDPGPRRRKPPVARVEDDDEDDHDDDEE
jgi:large subunit ribosomal protein L9